MSQNKNAQIRYKALDKCFSNQYKKFYINDLINYCSGVLTEHYAQEVTVSRRQIFDDMDFMKSEAGYDAPIESLKDGRKVFYRYSDPEFSILKKPLNPVEIQTLSEALQTLGRMSNLNGFSWVNTLVAKLESGMDIAKENKPIISFEENEFLIGVELLNPLYHYILNEQCVTIFYQHFKSEKIVANIVSPYYLKQYNNRWFLFGWNHALSFLQNFALDRIQDIQICQNTFQSNKINFEEYFDDIIGVSNDPNNMPQKIQIEITDEIKPYLVSKPLHGSQIIKENTLYLDVKINYELQSLILSFGEQMQVNKPIELREIIAQKLKAAAENYNNAG